MRKEKEGGGKGEREGGKGRGREWERERGEGREAEVEVEREGGRYSTGRYVLALVFNFAPGVFQSVSYSLQVECHNETHHGTEHDRG